MSAQKVTLEVPAHADFARGVRMLASSLAVGINMSVDEVEDMRMAAEEGFVFACATAPERIHIDFEISENSVAIEYSLGTANPEEKEDTNIDLIELLLGATCDDFGISEDGSILRLEKSMDDVDAD